MFGHVVWRFLEACFSLVFPLDGSIREYTRYLYDVFLVAVEFGSRRWHFTILQPRLRTPIRSQNFPDDEILTSRLGSVYVPLFT